MQKIQDNLKDAINISTDISRKHCHESALMTAAHILICLTQDGKSINEIAREDFGDNLELVSVWADYMVGVNWMGNNHVNGKNNWVATDSGKIWVEKLMNHFYMTTYRSIPDQ